MDVISNNKNMTKHGKTQSTKTAKHNAKGRARKKKQGNDPKPTKEDKRNQVASELNITRRTKNFYDTVIDNPEITQKKAYELTHDTAHHENPNSAAVAASRLLNSDKYQIYKEEAVGKAKQRIVELVNSDSDNISLKASQDILDRTEGKAVQRHEANNRTVEVKMDLSGVRIGNHYIPKVQREHIEEEASSEEE